jgi:hypothetical protein
MMVSWFGPENQVGDGLSVAPQNQWEDYGVRHVSRSSGLLCLEASRARVSQFASKLVEALWWVVHVASLQRLHQGQVEDGWVDVTGCVVLFYRKIVVFYILGPRGVLVFCLGL